MGKDCKQVLKRLELSVEQLKKPKIILETPERNILYKRYLFHSAEQQANETVDQYILRLQRLAGPCKFAALHEEMLHDRLVLESRDKAAQARLFHEKDCHLHRAIDTLRISEITQEQLRNISGTEEDVHAVSSTSKYSSVAALGSLCQEKLHKRSGNRQCASTVGGSIGLTSLCVQHMENCVDIVTSLTTSSQCAGRTSNNSIADSKCTMSQRRGRKRILMIWSIM